MKKITIMIPTYNQSKYIGQAIQSAQKIEYENLEIIVSDDNSIDDTQEVVSKFMDDKRIKYFKNEPNLGRVANYRKTLYEYATGDYVLNLDGDDWLLESNFFSEAVKLLNSNEKISCVLGDRKNYYESKKQYITLTNKENISVSSLMDGNDFFINYPNIGFIFSHFSCLYRRSLAINLNFYSKDIVSSDIESILKLYLDSDVAYIPKIVGVWRAHESNTSYTRNIQQTIENLSKYNAAYDMAKEKKLFDMDKLDDWLLDMKKSNLSQDILYEFRSFSLQKSIFFLYYIFRYDKKLALLSLIMAFRKGIIKILNKGKL